MRPCVPAHEKGFNDEVGFKIFHELKIIKDCIQLEKNRL